jgi:hypothetical protein
MIKNHLSSYGRLLLSFTMLFVMLLISGCCSFCDEEITCPEVDCEDCPQVQVDAPSCDCDEDIMFTFNIPKDGDCPDGTVFVSDSEAIGVLPHDGGAGVVDRDGGAGVVDRDGNAVTDFCLKECPGGVYDPTEVPWMLVATSSENGFLTAETICGGPSDP